MKLIKTYKIKIILIILVIIICYIGYLFSKNPENKTIKIDKNEIFKVEKVIDGDTIEIRMKGKIVTVRMLGIDTPETVDPRKPIQCFGKEASDKTKELLNEHYVKIDGSFFDKYNRLLAYVYENSSGIMINKYLIENGFAKEYTYGNSKYSMQNEFKALQKQAKKTKIGLWGLFCSK